MIVITVSEIKKERAREIDSMRERDNARERQERGPIAREKEERGERETDC